MDKEAQLRPAQAQARAAFELCTALLHTLPGCAQAPIHISCNAKGTHAKPSLSLAIDNIPFQNDRAIQASLLAQRVAGVRGMLGRMDWSGPQRLWSYATSAIERHTFSAPEPEQAAIKHTLLIHGDDPVPALQRARTGYLHLPAEFVKGNIVRRHLLIDTVLGSPATA